MFSRSPVVTENLDRLLRLRSRQASDPQALRRLQDYLTSVRERFTDYVELSVVDPEAGVVASTGDADMPQLPEDWLTRVGSGEEIQGLVYRDDILGQVMMVIAVPIRAPDDRFLGAFSAKVNFRTIDEALRNVVIGETGFLPIRVSARFILAVICTFSSPKLVLKAFSYPAAAREK